MKRRDLESPIQRAILDTLAICYPAVFVASIPNGGFILEPRTVARLKWQGLKPGMPDLALYWPGDHGLIEVKSTTGRLSTDQVAVHAELKARGVKLGVCRSVEDLHETLADWSVPNRIARAA